MIIVHRSPDMALKYQGTPTKKAHTAWSFEIMGIRLK